MSEKNSKLFQIIKEEEMRKIYSDWDNYDVDKKRKLLKETEEEISLTEKEMRGIYSNWDSITEEKRKQFFKEMRDIYPDWDSFTIDKKRQLLTKLRGPLNHEYDCPFWSSLTLEQRIEYNSFVPKKTDAIFWALLFLVLGLIIIIIYDSFMDGKIKEFNYQFYKDNLKCKHDVKILHEKTVRFSHY